MFNGRKALNQTMAIDGTIAFLGLGGDVPGFALPFYYGGNIWNPVNIGKGKLSGFSFPLSGNLEFQVLHTPRASLIAFGGLNLVMSRLTILTPYNAKTGATTAARTNFKSDATAVLGGFQFGMQAGIPIGPIQLVPYWMMNYESGSATFEFKEGYQGVTSFVETGVVDIEPFTFATIGGDIVYSPWGLSLGALFQQANAKKSQNGYKLTVIQLAWHFRGKS